MQTDRRAPLFVRILFGFLVPASIREETLGDLNEGYARIASHRGRWAARWWAWRQLFTLKPIRLRRAIDSGPLMGAADLKHAVRSLRARPGASLTVVCTIAVALGITTGVFSVVRGVLLNPLPYPESDRLVRAWQTKNSWIDSPNHQLRSFALRFPLSMPTFNDWVAGDVGFEAIGAYTGGRYVEQGSEGAQILEGERVTSGVMATLGVPALLGRTLLPEDDRVGAPRIAVLAYSFWRDRFDARNDVLDQTITLDGEAHAIVGVMPPDFRPLTRQGAQLWTPLPEETKLDTRDSQYLQVIGRLAPNVSQEAAAERLASFQARLAEQYPDDQGDVGSRVVGLLDSVVGDLRSTLWFLFGSVALVLLVACANIANILSVLGISRRREMAVKAALGASSGRLIGGLFLEAALLAGVGGLLGLGLAWLSLPALLRFVPPTVPRYSEIGLDPGVLAFGLALTAITAVLVGVLPAAQASRTDPSGMIRRSSRGMAGERSGSRVRSALVSLEVALAFVLLVGAGLLGTSFANLWSVDRGFATESLLVFRTTPDPLVYIEEEDEDQFVRELRRGLEAIPGVEVSAANQVPLSGSMSTTTYRIEREQTEPEERSVVISVVLENYHDLMEIPIVEGRAFESTDMLDAPPVGIVSATMAETLWPGESALGKRLRAREDEPWTTVVGVASDVRHSGLEVAPEVKLYVPVWQNHRHPTQWVIRFRGDVAGVTALARDAVAAVSPTTPVRSVDLIEQQIARSVAVPRFRTIFVVGLAAMAGLLALIGVYGVVTFAVAQRTQEIGVRMALGARAGLVVRQVVGSGLKLAVAGIAVGAVIAFALAEAVSDFLFEVEATNVMTYTLIALGVAAVSAAAAYLPARRAAAIDPMRVLNSD